MKNKIIVVCLLCLGFCLFVNANAQENKKELTSRQIQQRLEAMREAAARRYAMQEKVLEERLKNMQRWLKRRLPEVDEMSAEQKAIVKRNYQAYQILLEYYKSFVKLNKVRGTSDEVELFKNLRKLTEQYEKLTGEKVPLTPPKKD